MIIITDPGAVLSWIPINFVFGSNRLQEAVRVLQPGGLAAFSVWGRIEESAQMTILPAAAKAVGVTGTSVSVC